jgi:hypothetical protein
MRDKSTAAAQAKQADPSTIKYAAAGKSLREETSANSSIVQDAGSILQVRRGLRKKSMPGDRLRNVDQPY